MQNLMTRRFTLREKILMLVLIVILLLGLYFFLVFYPVRNQLQGIDKQIQDVEDEQLAADILEKRYADMNAELEEIFSMQKDEITYMPEFDNMNQLLACFYKIFENNTRWDYDSSESTKDGIVTRTIRLTFEATDFENAKEVLGKLTDTGYRCLLKNLSLSPSGNDVEDGALRISLSIDFYEIQKIN